MNTIATTRLPSSALDDDIAQRFDAALAATPPGQTPQQPSVASRHRLGERLAASREAEAAMATTRLRRTVAREIAPGVTERLLYAAADGRALRPGEPLRARLIDLAPGSRWTCDAALVQRHLEWLVLAGEACVDDQRLGPRDYHVRPRGCAAPIWSTHAGARLFLRESDTPARAGDAPLTVRDAEAGWPDYAPGIQRRVLWQRDGMAALLYRGAAGIEVPHHTHGHDEECLMVEGELFLDDQLLQAGDYQLAQAGSGHRITHTDVGAVIYAHGDLDLRFVA